MDECEITDPDLIILALLHDVREDTWMLSHYRVVVNWGETVANWLDLLTKQPGTDYFGRLRSAPWQPLLVKLADRLHNQRTLGACSPEKQARKHAETQKTFPLLVRRLVGQAPADLQPAGHYLWGCIEATFPVS